LERICFKVFHGSLAAFQSIHQKSGKTMPAAAPIVANPPAFVDDPLRGEFAKASNSTR
jgi:hypothetical protein